MSIGAAFARVAMAHRVAWLIALAGSPAVAAHPESHAAVVHAPAPARAPGYGDLGFEAPAPGTYGLPSLGYAADGLILDGAGQPRHLHDLMSGKVVLLSFIYTGCSDVNGCPLATWVLGRVQTPVSTNPILRERVRLLTLSFDPARDTPARMQDYATHFRQAEFDWQFLTTTGESRLLPILEAYDQRISPERDTGGGLTGNLSHLLRVYLIDEQRRIRNIYNANFLHPDILLNDLQTVIGSGN
ncbi:MAG: SCO family protein [Gammaproteobacteria bacterium]|nr:SCO family protein [Gammaproteobacteria bacterium]